MMGILRTAFDRFTLLLIGTVVLASVLPCSGRVATWLDVISSVGIAWLFFLHGARLPRDAIIAGLSHWRLHGLVLLSTFALFPLLGWLAQPLLANLLSPMLALGILYLCTLPSTVQSSIALTSIARGNVAAAICSASASNLFGVLATPLLVGLLLSGTGETAVSLQAVGSIVVQLLLPFVVGHLSRPWTAATVVRWSRLLAWSDRGTILLVVYVAFSASVVDGLWRQVPWTTTLATLAAVSVLLTLVLSITTWISRRLGFVTEDEIAIVFCGSKKSLATGVPMAKILFAGNPALGMIVLPVMLYHQLQLMTCSILAQRYARRTMQVAGEE